MGRITRPACACASRPSGCGELPPIPQPSFLDDQEYLGFRYGSRRWRSSDRQRLYTWDDTHNHIEVYDRRGNHLGVLNNEGVLIDEAVKGRRIDV